MDKFNQFLEWLERVVPSAIAFFSLGYKLGSDESAKLRKKNEGLALEIKFKENEDAIKTRDAAKSDNDIIDEHIKRAEVPKPK